MKYYHYILFLSSVFSLKNNLKSFNFLNKSFNKLIGLGFGASVFLVNPDIIFAQEQKYKLPPIDFSDKYRCSLVSSSMGQANAARDKLFDLRQCDLKGQSGTGKDLSGVIAENTDFSGINFREAQFSKGYARRNKFIGCDFTNAILDRVSFDGSDMSKSVFANAVLSGTTFADANLADTDFSEAYLGPFDLKNLCLNPTLQGTNPVMQFENIHNIQLNNIFLFQVTGKVTRESAGCIE
jgi:uncharacterized protein YjbI with pentapeptide repeats